MVSRENGYSTGIEEPTTYQTMHTRIIMEKIKLVMIATKRRTSISSVVKPVFGPPVNFAI
jgi:hypothetical protein